MIPNHCCVVTNMMDEVYAARNGGSRRSIRSQRGARFADAVPLLDPALLDPAAISAETLAINAEILAETSPTRSRKG